MRKTKELPPKVGVIKPIRWLPRDISLGHSNSPKGTFLVGWDLTNDTLQVWQIIDDENAKFIGFVVKELK